MNLMPDLLDRIKGHPASKKGTWAAGNCRLREVCTVCRNNVLSKNDSGNEQQKGHEWNGRLSVVTASM